MWVGPRASPPPNLLPVLPPPPPLSLKLFITLLFRTTQDSPAPSGTRVYVCVCMCVQGGGEAYSDFCFQSPTWRLLICWLHVCHYEVLLQQEVVFQRCSFLTEWGWWGRPGPRRGGGRPSSRGRRPQRAAPLGSSSLSPRRTTLP